MLNVKFEAPSFNAKLTILSKQCCYPSIFNNTNFRPSDLG